ncbi:threonine-phosphate decarboxylase CobD [Streptococcus merionis]|uniref:threonine-phosphate decarboxylase CobD n=1 Tax=Streptococcus merionis TaxID=400065 RepID=UPI0026F18D76|nr:threonine-phosphate decarboxylase CobD [Streptococcus merionis]
MRVEHGGDGAILAEKLGIPAEDYLDFSANINPLGLSPRLRETLVAAVDQLVAYPDSHYRHAKAAIAAHHQYEPQHILLANGAVDIFYELARYFRPQTVVTLSPTFMEYEKAFLQVGSKIAYCVLAAPDYTWDVETLLPTIASLSKGDVVLLCNPNNPTGTLQKADSLREIARYLLEKEALLVLDEAFIDFLENESSYSLISYLQEFPNVIVVRSLTKFYAIPGLRLGYAVSTHPMCFAQIEEQRAPWTVNALADRAVPTILADTAYQQETRQWLAVEKAFLFSALTSFPQLQVVKPSVNYIFFEYTGELGLRRELWKEQIFIRSCSNYHHLSDRHYRVAIRSRQENEALIAALGQVLAKEVAHE